MLRVLIRNWWLVLLRGALAVIFGLLAFAWPAMTIEILVVLFGAYSLADGLFRLLAAITRSGAYTNRGLLVIQAILGIGIGIATLIWPAVTAAAILYFIAAWALLIGVLEVIAAFQLRKEIEGEWALALSGAASVIFGVLLMIWPGAGALALVWLIASYAIVMGGVLIVLALRLRSWSRSGLMQAA